MTATQTGDRNGASGTPPHTDAVGFSTSGKETAYAVSFLRCKFFAEGAQKIIYKLYNIGYTLQAVFNCRCVTRPDKER